MQKEAYIQNRYISEERKMAKYIVLLRGINVSGKNKVSMPILKSELELINYKKVTTYLNSGNIVLESDIEDQETINQQIKYIIEKNFSINIPVLIITRKNLEELLSNQPIWWGKDDKEIYDNIIFIIPPATFEEVTYKLKTPKNELEKVQGYKNYIFWSYKRSEYQKTNWWSKTAQGSVKDTITIRNANTVKKLLEISKL
jgi:uncharacterized protein (DUF1697 family)